MSHMLGVAILLVIVAITCTTTSVTATALDDYVNKPDPAYQWVDLGIRQRGPGCTFYVLNMTSQSWLSTGDWKFTNGAPGNQWWHYVLIAIPDVITKPESAFLFVTGGYNDKPSNIPSNTTRDAGLLISMGVENGMVAAAVYQVPNQPIVFTADPLQHSRAEDAILAFSWNQYMTLKYPEWIARLPMTKAAVRAMDSVIAFTEKTRATHITQYIVGGASKRGWTSWTTAAVDKRVVGTIPMVMDELNFITNLKHHYRAYNGGWSFALDDYWEANLTRKFDEPALHELMAIEDPIAYASRLTMPKLVICAGGDEFFLPDDQLYFWDKMQGDTYSLMLGNTGHSLAPVYTTLVAAAQAFTWSIVNQKERPKFTWVFDNKTGTITVTSQDQPSAVNLWYAYSAPNTGRRDFRIAAGWPQQVAQNVPWLSTPVPSSQAGKWVASAPIPPVGQWTAFFVEMLFGSAPRVFRFTTNAGVFPDTFPAEECHGTGCYGKLV